MKILLVDLFLILKKYKFFKKFLIKVYSRGNRKLLSQLKLLHSVKSVYLVSDVDSKNFEYAISDLDYCIILKDNSDLLKIETIFKKLSGIYPFIKDYDAYVEKDFNFQLVYRGGKFSSFSSWKRVLGDDFIGGSYFYHPFKLYLDQINEVYSLIIWLFENRKLNRSLYRKAVLKRTLKKIVYCFHWMREPEAFSRPSTTEFSDLELRLITSVYDSRFDSLWIEYLNTLDFIPVYLSCLTEEFFWPEKNYKTKITNKGKRFEVGKYNFTTYTDTNAILITEELFDSFFRFGCIDVDTNFIVSRNLKNSIFGLLMEVKGVSRILDGENSSEYKLDRENLSERCLTYLGWVKTSYEKPYPFFNKNVFISVNWGYDPKRQKAFLKSSKENVSQKGEYHRLHLDLGDNIKSLEFMKMFKINYVSIDMQPHHTGLWHKEALYNWGVDFCFGSSKYIFSDAEVYSEDDAWLKKIYEKLDENDFVHGFRSVKDTVDKSYNDFSWTYKYLKGVKSYSSPGLVWGCTARLLKRINGINDIYPDGSNDGAFLEELTGSEMGSVKKFDWYNDNLRNFNEKTEISYVDVDVIHVNHGESRDYVNRGMMLDLAADKLSEIYVKDELGIYKYRDYYSKKNELIQLKNDFINFEPEAFLGKVDYLIEQNLIKIPKNFSLKIGEYENSFYSVKNGLAVVYETKDGYCLSMSRNTTEDTTVKIRIYEGDIYQTEHVYLRYEIISKNDYVKTSVEYDWWTQFGANDINEMVFKNREKKMCEHIVFGYKYKENIHFCLNISKVSPSEKIYIKKIAEDRISSFHSWTFEKELSFEYKNIKFEKNAIVLPVDFASLPIGWGCFELSFDGIIDQKIRTTLVSGNLGKSVAPTRVFDNCNEKYQKVLFYKTQFLIDPQIWIKFLDSKKVSSGFNSLKVKIFKRTNLNSNQ